MKWRRKIFCNCRQFRHLTLMNIVGQFPNISDALMDRALSRVADFNRLREEGLICRSGDFFPSVHYPPITMYDEVHEEKLFEGYTLQADGKLNVNGQSPSCNQRSIFCPYPVSLA